MVTTDRRFNELPFINPLIYICIYGLLLLLSVNCATSHSEGKWILADKNKVYVKLVIPDSPSEYIQQTFASLQYYMGKCLQQPVPFVSHSQWKPDTDTHTIYLILGTRETLEKLKESEASGELKKAVASCDGFKALQNQRPGSIVIQTILHTPKMVLITGNEEEGLNNAVYEWLERYMKMRWYAPYELFWVIPQTLPFEISEPDFQYEPVFAHRGLYYSVDQQAWENPEEAEKFEAYSHWHEAMRLGGIQIIIDPAYALWFPPMKYLESHPEFYPIVDGTRVSDPAGYDWQLCLGHPDLINHFDKLVQAQLEQYDDVTMISLTPNPTEEKAWGECEGEIKAFTPVQKLINLANMLAQSYEQSHPDIRFSFMVHSYLADPPAEGKLHKNVVVGVANRTLDTLHAFSDEKNPDYDIEQNRIQNWLKLGSGNNFLILDKGYGCGRQIPLMTLSRESQNIRFFAEHGFLGYQSPIQWNWVVQGFMYYATAKLLWNPSLDTDVLLTQYCQDLYGTHGDHVKTYFQKLIQAVDNTSLSVQNRSKMDSVLAVYDESSMEAIQNAFQPIEKAFEQEEEPVLKQRISLLVQVHQWLVTQIHFLRDRERFFKRIDISLEALDTSEEDTSEEDLLVNEYSQAVTSSNQMFDALKRMSRHPYFQDSYSTIEQSLIRSVYPYIIKLRSKHVYERKYFYEMLKAMTEQSLPFDAEAEKEIRQSQVDAWLEWWQNANDAAIIFPSIKPKETE